MIPAKPGAIARIAATIASGSRASKQIVLSGHVDTFDAVIGWTLAKAQDTPLAIRDLERDEFPIQV